MKRSTSIDIALCDCLRNSPKNYELLFYTLYDRIEDDMDRVSSVEEKYLIELLNVLCAIAKDKMRIAERLAKETQKEVIIASSAPAVPEVSNANGCNESKSVHTILSDDKTVSEDKPEKETKQYGTNFHKGSPKVDAPKQKTMDDYGWRCKKSMTKSDIKKAIQVAAQDKNPNRPVKILNSSNFVDKKELERRRIAAKSSTPKNDTTNLFSVSNNAL